MPVMQPSTSMTVMGAWGRAVHGCMGGLGQARYGPLGHWICTEGKQDSSFQALYRHEPHGPAWGCMGRISLVLGKRSFRHMTTGAYRQSCGHYCVC